MIVEENYDQFENDIKKAVAIAENYVLEEFPKFFTFTNTNQKNPTTIEELQ